MSEFRETVELVGGPLDGNRVVVPVGVLFYEKVAPPGLWVYERTKETTRSDDPVTRFAWAGSRRN